MLLLQTYTTPSLLIVGQALPKFSLRFDRKHISYWAVRYNQSKEYRESKEPEIERVIAPRTKAACFFNKEDFLVLCRWKSPRPEKLYRQNSLEFIKAVTQTALLTRTEQLQIEVLTLLRGVSWPVASVLLHFGCTEPYPILDFRSLWSLSVEEPKQYDFPFWLAYTHHCRHLAEINSVSMRTLDRALWQYCKENRRSQP